MKLLTMRNYLSLILGRYCKWINCPTVITQYFDFFCIFLFHLLSCWWVKFTCVWQCSGYYFNYGCFFLNRCLSDKNKTINHIQLKILKILQSHSSLNRNGPIRLHHVIECFPAITFLSLYIAHLFSGKTFKLNSSRII